VIAEFLVTPSKCNKFQLKLNKTKQHLDNKRYNNITVTIYVIFVQ